MKHAQWIFTGQAEVPAILRIGAYETPVWMQQRWTEGEFSQYVRRNGCGHCCTAMAARLHGVQLDPHQEFAYCRTLWGAPAEDWGQGPWLSTAGIGKVLRSLGVPAQEYGVKQTGSKAALDSILRALPEGKQVIFTSNPDEYPENPFSKGYHWVLAADILNDGRILIANSSENAAPTGIQCVTPEMIEKALFREATAPEDMTWGETDRIGEGSGYIIVG